LTLTYFNILRDLNVPWQSLVCFSLC